MKRLSTNFIILFGILLVGIVSYILTQFAGALALGVFIYYSVRPIYNIMLSLKINRTISAFVAPLVFLTPVFILIFYTIRVIVLEIRSIILQYRYLFDNLIDQEFIELIISSSQITSFPQPQELQRITIGDFSEIATIFNQDMLYSISNILIESSLSLFSLLSGLFFTLFIAFSLTFYLLRDGWIIKNKTLKYFKYDKTVTEFFKKLDRDLKIVFFGNILLAILTGLFAAFIFTLLAQFAPGGEILTYPALVGILCGVTSLIPVIGMKLVYWPMTVILFISGYQHQTLIDALIFPIIFFTIGLIIIDTIPDLIARPYLGSMGGISTSILLFSYVFGPLVFGWYGLFLGPIIFVVFYEFIEIILPDLIYEYS